MLKRESALIAWMFACAGFACQALLDIEPDAAIPVGDDAGADADGAPSDGATTADVDIDADAAACGNANLAVDPDHCGQCGHSCLRGSCENGRCQPFKLVELDGPWYLAADDSYLYVTTRRKQALPAFIYRVDKSAGTVDVVVDDQPPDLTDLALRGDELYWSFKNDPGMRRRLRDGGGTEETLTNVVHVVREIVNANGTLWATEQTNPADPAAGEVLRWKSDSDFSQHPLAGAVGIAADDQYVYATGTENGPGITRFGDAEPTTFAPLQTAAHRLAVDSRYVYWISEDTSLGRVDKQTRVAESILTKNPNGAGGIAVDATHLYFVNGGSNTVQRIALGDKLGEPEVIASELQEPIDILVDNDAIYFTDHTSGALWRLAK